MINPVKILNIDILSITKQELLTKMTNGILFTPNVDHLVKLQSDKEFYNAYMKAEWVVCDSRILALILKLLKRPVKEVIPGSSLFPEFCNYHRNNRDIKIFLLGAAPGVAKKAMQNINARSDRDIVVDYYSPPHGFETSESVSTEILNIINASSANVLAVGLGAPKQEKWITENRHKLTKIKLFMALGATIDFEAGNVKRAPIWVQRISMEWLYRLLTEPKRLWKRYLVDDLQFFLLILKFKLGLYKNPFEKHQ